MIEMLKRWRAQKSTDAMIGQNVKALMDYGFSEDQAMELLRETAQRTIDWMRAESKRRADNSGASL